MERCLSTYDALTTLKNKLAEELSLWQKQSWQLSSFTTAFDHSERRHIFCWFYFCCQLYGILCYLVCGLALDNCILLVVLALLMAFLSLLNLYVSYYVNCLRKTEVLRKAECILRKLDEYRSAHWNLNMYPSLYSQVSECINLQWTYRDGVLVNLPWKLLVEGDVVLLRPGREAPAKCRRISTTVDDKTDLRSEFDANETYIPTEMSGKQKKSGTETYTSICCQLLETPAVAYFRSCLQAQIRPATVFDNELFVAIHHYGERVVLPLLFVSLMLWSCVRYFAMPSASGSFVEMFFLYPTTIVIIPLCNFVIPLITLMQNVLSMTRVLATFLRGKRSEESGKSSESLKLFTDSDPDDPNCLGSMKNLDNHRRKFTAWRIFKKLVSGDPKHLPLSSNLVQTLGNATVLSIVDKKGILSWPNPTPEKLFFFRHGSEKDRLNEGAATGMDLDDRVSVVRSVSKDQVSRSPSTSSSRSRRSFTQSQAAVETTDDEEVDDKVPSDRVRNGPTVELLDFSHDPDQAFVVHFDDARWTQYLSSLKPLGLNIMLNNCEFAREYCNFVDNIHVVAESVPRTIAVVNRRCLCYLARIIGFHKSAINTFSEERRLVMTYRKTPGELPLPGLIKHRTPLANSFSVVVRDRINGQYHCMNQGTADILLDTCEFYWDGLEVRKLSRSQKKKISDFYNRYSMTAYCLGFSYCPVNVKLAGNQDKVVIEWPAEPKSELKSKHHSSSSERDFSLGKRLSEFAISLDSLLTDGFLEVQNVENVQDYLMHTHSNQVFLGLIVMQYQAKPDVVRMVEQLEKACIRFVHFSKENELRSRVFAEKMGLEAGWNCHISLSSDGSAEDLGSAVITHRNRQRLGSLKQRFNLFRMLRNCNWMVQPIGGLRNWFSLPSNLKFDLPVVHFKCSPENTDHDSAVEHDADSASINSADVAENVTLMPRTPLEVNFPLPRSLADGDVVFHKERKNTAAQMETSSHTSVVTSNSSTTGGFATSQRYFPWPNRSGLPKGIENVRPHLANVDNVPLLVPLFTDCTASATREMICIMQDFGEVVAVGGSSANYNNAEVFLQADVAIDIEPLQPATCAFQDDIKSCEHGPMQLMNLLSSLPCSLCISAGQHISLLQLISLSRHLLSATRVSLLFLSQAYLSVVVIQFLAFLLFLPPVFTPGHTFVLVCFTLPLLAGSLYFSSGDVSTVLKVATGKNQNWFRPSDRSSFLLSLSVKFCPSLLIILIAFWICLYSICSNSLELPLNSTEIRNDCGTFFVGFNNETLYMLNGWSSSEYKTGLAVAQDVAVVAFVIYCVFISVSFVNYRLSLWQCLPFRNRVWCLVCFVVVAAQLLLVSIDLFYIRNSSQLFFSFSTLPFFVYILLCLWPIIMLCIVELLKSYEIQLYTRDQRRRRLNFGTKLGMNSPF